MGAIGVFDSGVGGLSVLREIRRELPHEPVLYIADSAFAPYGDKSADFVTTRTHALADFLIGQGATSLVVACNTATAVSIDALRESCPVPVVGVEPGVKPAVEQTKSGVVGVLTTSRTALSTRFKKLLLRHGASTRIVVQACSGWVELVERGTLAGPEAESAVAGYVRPLVLEGADVLVLGCTHYGFLGSAIRAVAGPSVQLLDPAPAVARHLRSRLEHLHLLSGTELAPPIRMFTSANPGEVSIIASAAVGLPLTFEALPVELGRRPETMRAP